MLTFLKDKTFLTILLSALGFIIAVKVMFYNKPKESHQDYAFSKLTDTPLTILDSIICSNLNSKLKIEVANRCDSVDPSCDTIIGCGGYSKNLITSTLPKKQSSQIEFFVSYPGFGVWLILMLIQITLWFSLIIPVIYLIYSYKSNDIRKSLSIKGNKIIFNFILALGAMGSMVYAYYENIYDSEIIPHRIFPLAFSKEKIQLLTMIGYGVATLLFTALLCTGSLLQTEVRKITSANNISVSSLKNFIKNYQKLKGDFIAILCALGFMLSLMTISTSVCFDATNRIVAMFFNLPEGLTVTLAPLELAAAYGLLNSLFLAIFFIPVYTKFYLEGKNIKNKILNTEQISEDEKTSIDSELLSNKTHSFLKIFFLIVSPLLSGVLPDIFSGIFS
ncbi:MAG: hypothetical protein WBP31_15205 [Chitinophagales bacterium]|jgi:hypothetical protein|nr:hypothetical protein [Bacteroidota bacterium]MBL0280924.1 hypothetical protein [Bacteroidota bacterium]MBP9880458.1 hypothetical protein [Chitinophagales bacterium]